MTNETGKARFNLVINGTSYQLREAEFNGILFELVAMLVFKRRVNRATFILTTSEAELCGSGGSHFDSLCVGLYRLLKENRYHGPAYHEFGGHAESFHLHSIRDGLAAVAFFVKAGEYVPHFIAGMPKQDVLMVLDRGRRSRIELDDPELLGDLSRLIPVQE